MTSPVSAVEDIEQAMEGVTHSDWFMSPWHVEEDASAVRNKLDGSYICNASSDRFAAYIASCNPIAMREVLALARQAEALQREVDSLKRTRQHSREASVSLHDTFMAEKKRAVALEEENAELREQLENMTALKDIDAMKRGEYSDRIIILEDEISNLRAALEMIAAEAKESNEPIGRSVYKALATCGEIADVALRTLLGGENAE